MNILQNGLDNATHEAVARAEEYPAVKAAFDALDAHIGGLGIELRAKNRLSNMITNLHMASAEAGFGLGLTAGFKLSNEVRALNEAGRDEGDEK